MEITVDEFNTLCNDIDSGGISRELNSHSDIFQVIEFVVSSQNCLPVVIATINKYLAIGEERNRGFQVLHIVLKHLPMALVEQKAILWSNFAVEFNRVDVNSERFLVLAQLIKICHANQNQDFNRHATGGGLIKKIIDKCLSLRDLLKASVSVHYAMIHVLNICLQTYPGSCGHYKPQIETFLLKYLDSPNKKGNIEEAGACLHYLQQAGPTGPSHRTHIHNWTNQVRKLCATIQDLYDKLFSTAVDHFEFDTPEIEPYKFEHMSSCDSLNTAMLNGRRLQGLIVFLGEMISNVYPVEKQVPSKLILDVMQRGLSINMTDENKHMIDNVNSKWVLQIKLELLLVFKHWINIMGKNAKLYHTDIIDILVNTMKKIEKPSLIFNDYQLKIYNVLSYYIDRVKPAISRKYQEQIIEHFLIFITPNKSNVTLNIDISLSGKSLKGKKRSIDQRIIESGNNLKTIQEAHADKEIRENVCIAALKVLNILFKAIHVKIGERSCLGIFDTIIPILNDLHKKTPSVPYDNENCQVELYNFLLKIYNQPFLPRQLSLSLGLMYFSYAQYKDNNSVKVSETCEKAMNILEKTCQPICSSLYIPERYSDETMATMEKRKKAQQVLDGFWINQNDDVLVRINKDANVTEHNLNVPTDSTEQDNEIVSETSKLLDSPKSEKSTDLSSNDQVTICTSPSYSVFSSPEKILKKKINILAETIIPSENDIGTNSPEEEHFTVGKSLDENDSSSTENSTKLRPMEALFKSSFKHETDSPISSVFEVAIHESSPINITSNDDDDDDGDSDTIMHEESIDKSSSFFEETKNVSSNKEQGIRDPDFPNIHEMVESFIAEPNF